MKGDNLSVSVLLALAPSVLRPPELSTADVVFKFSYCGNRIFKLVSLVSSKSSLAARIWFTSWFCQDEQLRFSAREAICYLILQLEVSKVGRVLQFLAITIWRARHLLFQMMEDFRVTLLKAISISGRRQFQNQHLGLQSLTSTKIKKKIRKRKFSRSAPQARSKRTRLDFQTRTSWRVS